MKKTHSNLYLVFCFLYWRWTWNKAQQSLQQRTLQQYLSLIFTRMAVVWWIRVPQLQMSWSCWLRTATSIPSRKDVTFNHGCSWSTDGKSSLLFYPRVFIPHLRYSSIRIFLIFLALVKIIELILRQYIAEELERRESSCANLSQIIKMYTQTTIVDVWWIKVVIFPYSFVLLHVELHWVYSSTYTYSLCYSMVPQSYLGKWISVLEKDTTV